MNPFEGYAPFCKRPLPLPHPFLGNWHKHKHTPSHTHTLDLDATFQSSRAQTVAAKEWGIFVDQPIDRLTDRVIYRAVGRS